MSSLSPAAPLILPPQIKGTYLVVYGPAKTFLIVLVLVLMGAVSSYLLGLHPVLWPLQGLMLGVGGEGRGREGWEVGGGGRGMGWEGEENEVGRGGSEGGGGEGE